MGSYALARRTAVAAAVWLLAVLSGGIGPSLAQEGREAPFGDEVSDRISYYDRVHPMIATAGPLGRLGIMEAKGIGFRAVVNLQPSPTESANEQSVAEFARLRYFNLPVAGALPDDAQIDELADYLAEESNLPVLIHGIDRDQAAAAWALYRATQGVPPEIAFEEGEAAGLRERAAAVRERLGLPAS